MSASSGNDIRRKDQIDTAFRKSLQFSEPIPAIEEFAGGDPVVANDLYWVVHNGLGEGTGDRARSTWKAFADHTTPPADPAQQRSEDERIARAERYT